MLLIGYFDCFITWNLYLKEKNIINIYKIILNI